MVDEEGLNCSFGTYSFASSPLRNSLIINFSYSILACGTYVHVGKSRSHTNHYCYL